MTIVGQYYNIVGQYYNILQYYNNMTIVGHEECDNDDNSSNTFHYIKVSGITGGGKSINIIFIHTRIISFKTNQLAVFLRTKLLK